MAFIEWYTIVNTHFFSNQGMLLQENTLFDLGVKITISCYVSQLPLHYVAWAPAKFEVATVNQRFRRRCINNKNTLFY